MTAIALHSSRCYRPRTVFGAAALPGSDGQVSHTRRPSLRAGTGGGGTRPVADPAFGATLWQSTLSPVMGWFWLPPQRGLNRLQAARTEHSAMAGTHVASTDSRRNELRWLRLSCMLFRWRQCGW